MQRTLLVFLFFIMSQSQGQTPDPEVHGCAIGDRVPDIRIGERRLSDYRGKLIIFEFWNSYCGSCIEWFPRLAELQKTFGDSIQIFLVNPDETEDVIEGRFKLMKIKRPSLPMLSGAKELNSLFPHTWAGYTVWIDQHGVVCLLGADVNNNVTKIRDQLAGRPFKVVPDPVTYNRGPIENILAREREATAMGYRSLIVPWVGSYGLGGGKALGVYDSATHTIRNSYLNFHVLELVYVSMDSTVVTLWKKRIKSVRLRSGLDNFVLNVRDTAAYDDVFLPRPIVDDRDLTRNMYAYEQYLPVGFSPAQQRAMMFSDLNNYFKQRLGASFHLQNQVEKILVLKKITPDPLPRSRHRDRGMDTIVDKGNAYVMFKGEALRSIVNNVFSENFFGKGMDIFIDESGVGHAVDMKLPLPSTIKSLADLNTALKSYNLVIVQELRPWPRLIVTDR